MFENIIILFILILLICIGFVLLFINRWAKENNQPKLKDLIKDNIHNFKENWQQKF